MASQGPNNPGTATSDSSSGTKSWSNPSNIYTDNGTNADAYGGSTWTTHYLKAVNFGFTIPSGATIDGIIVDIKRYKSGAEIQDARVSLIKGGTVQTENKYLVTNWTSTDTYFTYGTSTDLWANSWSDTDINNSTFGVVLQVAKEDFKAVGSAFVNHIRITVHYTESGSGPTSTSALMLALD